MPRWGRNSRTSPRTTKLSGSAPLLFVPSPESKAANAFDVLTAAVKSDSPDDTLREAGLGGLGDLGDDRAVHYCWNGPDRGKPLNTRGAAISAVARSKEK